MGLAVGNMKAVDLLIKIDKLKALIEKEEAKNPETVVEGGIQYRKNQPVSVETPSPIFDVEELRTELKRLTEEYNSL